MKNVIGRFEIQERFNRLFTPNLFFQALFARLEPAPIRVSRMDEGARIARRRDVLRQRYLPMLLLPVLWLGAPRAATAQSAGDYHSIASGNWNNTNTWQVFNGTAWVGTNTTPGTTSGVVTIQTGNTVNVSAAVTADQVVVQAGGQITVTNSQTLTIANGTGTDLDISGTIDVLGTLTISSGAAVIVENGGVFENSGTVNTTGTLTFNSGGTYDHMFTTSDGNIPTATWNVGSTCVIAGYTTFAGTPTGGWGQSFANFTWNCPNQTSANTYNINGALTTVNGNLTIISTGSGSVELATFSGTGTLSVGGNYSQTGGNFILSEFSTRTLTVAANFSLSGGTFNMSSSEATTTLNVGGDFSQTGGTITGSGANTIVFDKSGVQNYLAAGTINNGVDLTVNNGSTLNLATNVGVGSGTLTVNGTMVCGTNNLTGSGKFTLASNGQLQIGSAAGITASGATGNVQVSSTRSFSTGANYLYNGAAAQVTGNGLPTTVNNLTISNAAGVTLSGGVTVNGTLGLSNGIVATGANILAIPTTGTVSGAGAASYINGSLQRAFNTGNAQSYTFPIGDASYYLPLSLSSLNVTHSGSITAKTAASQDPAIASALINTSADVVRYWTVTNGSSLAATYAATFNYSANDVGAGATPAQFVVQNYNGSAWSSATVSGTPSTTSAAITGETAFGDFAIGNPKSTQTITFPAIGNQTYGVTPIALGATASSGLTVSYTASGPATISSGNLNITGAGSVTVNAVQAGNAAWAAATNSQTITVAKLPITGNVTFSTKGYDGTTSATIATRTLTGVINGDNVALSGGTSAFSSKNVGTNVTAVATGLSLINSTAVNYSLVSTSATNTANITTRLLTVTAVTVTKGYDGTTNSATNPTITSGTLATGDTSGFTQGFINRNVGTNKTVIPVGAVNDGNSGANYSVTFVNENVGKISTRTITATAVTSTKIYDGTTASAAVPNITSGTIATGDTAGFSETFNNRNVGTGKTLTPSGSVNDGNNGANYTVTFANVSSGSITIDSITVSAATDAKTYDGTTSSAGVPVMTVGSLGSGDTAGFTQKFSTRNAGTGLTLTPSGSISDGNNGANYSITFAPVNTGTISALPITVTGAAASKPYDGTTSSAVLPTITGTLGAGDSANFTQTYDTGTVGTGKTMTPAGSVSDGNNGANYSLTLVPASMGTITTATLTVSATGINKVYDGTTTASVVFGDDVLLNDSVSVTGGAAFSDANVGTNKPVTVTNVAISGPDSGNYTLASTTISTTASITPAMLTVTADNYTRATGAANPVFTASYAGFMTGDDTNSLQGAPLLTTTADTNSPEGTYPITATNGNLSAVNYNFTFVNGTLTVTPANLLFADTFARNSDPQPLLLPWTVESGNWTVTGGELEGGTNPPANFATAYIDTNWTDYSVEAKVQFSSLSALGGGIGGRLNAATGAHYAAWIYPANSAAPGLAGSLALIKFQDWQDWGYLGTGNVPIQQVALTNADTNWHTLKLAMRGNQIAVYLDGNQLINTNDAEAQPYLTGGITADMETDTNPYLMSLENVYVAAPVSQTVNFATVADTTYGSAPFDISAAATASSGLPVAYSIISGPATISNTIVSITGAGIVTVVASQAGNATYDVAPVAQQSFNVNPAPLSVNADNATSVYGAAIPALTGELAGVVNGDNITASFSTAATPASGVGAYAIVPGLIDPNSALTNYTVTETNGTLTITPAALSVTADSKGMVYGSAVPTLTGELTGVMNGDAITANYSTLATPASGVGPYAITPGLNDPNSALGNYTVTSVPGTLTVSPAPLTLTANGATQVYGAAQPTFTGSVAGVVNGDGITASYATAALPTSGVGSYAIVPSAVDPNSKIGNYSVSLVNGSLAITPAALTGTVASQSRPYGTTNDVFSVNYSGFVNGDGSGVVSGPITYVCVDSNLVNVDTNTAVGSYPIHVTLGQTAANYTIGYVDGSLTVTPAALLVSAQNESRVYGTTNPAPVATYVGFVNNEDTNVLSGSPEMDAQADTNSAVGTYPIVVSMGTLSNANYAMSFSNATLTVTAEALTVTADNLSSAYGAAIPTLTGEVSGLQPQDGITVAYNTTATTGSGVGGYAITPVLTDPNLALSNYTVTLTPGTLTVSPAALSVTADSLASVYGGAIPTLTGELTGVVNGDAITASYSTTATSASGVGSYAITASLNDPNSVLTNYTVTTTPGTLTVGPAALSVTADSLTSVYGGAIPTLTGELTGVVNGDAITASYSTPATPASAVGGYAITASLNDPNLALTNYTVTTTPGTLAVGPAALTLTANDATQVYGAPQPVFTGNVVGVVNGDGITANFATVALPTSGVGSYAIIPSAVDPNSALGNYTVSSINGTLTITPAPSSITWTNPADIVYGQALGDAQLNAIASVPGILTYDPPAGTILNVSNAQVLSVTLAPTDTNYTPAATSVLINVLQAATTAVVTSSTNPALPGTQVTFTATLNAVAPGNGTPTGVVQFSVDGSAVGAPVSLADGVAQLATATLSHGAHSITAAYAGDTNFTGSTNDMAAQQIINTPPVAPPYTVTSMENCSYTFPASLLMSQVTDADGDAVSLTAVTPTDTNGGVVTLMGQMITYTPAFGITNTESFTYTVTDTYGGTATGAVTVLVVPPPSGGPTQPVTILPNGHAAVALTAQPGESYMLQGSTDLQNWMNLGEVTASPDGMVRVEDGDAQNFNSRYYRLLYNDDND